MKRRFNYTGRRKIPLENITITLNREKGRIKSFSATIDLSNMNLPADAKVYIEAYHRTEQKLFEYGIVGNPVAPRDTSLTELAYTENLRFRILVVNQLGLIIAHADRITTVQETDKNPILPVEFRDIGQQIWQVRFEGDEGSPLLIINNRIPNIENISRAAPQFIIFVYPAVFREVLTYMVFVEGVESPVDPPVEWHRDWLDFAKRILPAEELPENLNPQNGDSFDKEEVENWIERVVEEFCASRNEWIQYIEQLTGGEI